MDHSQITGTASSYARKYALNGLYLIDDTKDADTDEYQKQSAKTNVKKASDKQLDLVTNLINKKTNDRDKKNQIFVEMIQHLKLNKEMTTWTSNQASQAIKHLQSDSQ